MAGCLAHRPSGLAGCESCRHAWRSYDRHRRTRIASGTWMNKVAPDVSVEHVGKLRDAGMTFHEIAEASGVDKTTLLRLHRRSWLTGHTEQAILAVAAPELYDPSADVDEVAVERVLAGGHVALNDAELIATLQACVARGQALSTLTLRLGLNYVVAKKLVAGELPPAMAKRAARGAA